MFKKELQNLLEWKLCKNSISFKAVGVEFFIFYMLLSVNEISHHGLMVLNRNCTCTTEKMMLIFIGVCTYLIVHQAGIWGDQGSFILIKWLNVPWQMFYMCCNTGIVHSIILRHFFLTSALCNRVFVVW